MKASINNIIVLFALLIFSAVFPLTANAGEVNTFAGLENAINAAPTSAKTSITVTANIDFTRQIVITSGKDIAIMSSGNNSFTIAAAGYRHFTVNTGGGLTLENITLDGGYTGTGTATRGGIDNSGVLSIDNGTAIQKCYASQGGGICNIGSGTVTINSSRIRENRANDYGGGIYISSNSRANITDCEIISNDTTQGNGGGICNYGTFIISGSEISNNKANAGGGGFWNATNATLTIIDCEISGNTGSNGGGILNERSVNIARSIISGNTANRDGSGVYNSATATISDSEISGNTAIRNGGGIINSENTSTIIVNNCKVINNSINASGGGIYNNGTAIISDSIVAENRASNSSSQGGGIYNSGTLEISGGKIYGNTAASGEGIGIYNSGNEVTIEDCEIRNN